MTYRVEIDRDESGAWIARVPSVPGCHTYGRTLSQVRGRIRETLGLWVADADRAALDFDIHLPADARAHVRGARAGRARATRTHEEGHAAMTSAATELTTRFGLSLRDTAELIGVSHQRVQQLVQAAGTGGRSDRRAR
jgi:predicted RNase H-like HicB family nuclease